MIFDPNEETITNNLSFFDLEPNFIHYRKDVRQQKKDNEDLYSFNEVSDWTNRYRLNNYCVQTQICNSPKIKKHIFNRTVLVRNRPSAIESPKKKQIQLSPINVKFPQYSSSNDSRSQRKSNKLSMRQTTVSIYDHNHRLLTQLYEQKISQLYKTRLRSTEQQASPVQLVSTRKPKLPKTEMKSSILRVMKKQQLIKTFRKKTLNIDAKIASISKSGKSMIL